MTNEGLGISTETLKRCGTALSLAAGQTLFGEGQLDDRLFFIESGSIDIGIGSREGQRLTLNVLRAGDVFGEVAMLDGGCRTAEAVALTDARLVSLRRAQFFKLFASRDEAYEFAVQLLCRRLRWANRHTEHAPLCSARVRLASRLLMMEEAGSGNWIQASQEEIAVHVGLTREYVNRLIGEWSAAGIVERRRGAVRIARREALAEFADDVV